MRFCLAIFILALMTIVARSSQLDFLCIGTDGPAKGLPLNVGIDTDLRKATVKNKLGEVTEFNHGRKYEETIKFGQEKDRSEDFVTIFDDKIEFGTWWQCISNPRFPASCDKNWTGGVFGRIENTGSFNFANYRDTGVIERGMYQCKKPDKTRIF